MWVYVKFLEDDVCEIVESSKIKRFDETDIKFSQKYSVEWKDGDYYKAQIIYAKESIEELTKLIENQRVRMMNKQLLESGDDSSEEVIPALPSKVLGCRKYLGKSISDLKKMAIENSKKNHELDILNTFKKRNENLEICKQKTSEKSSNDIITDLTKKNDELMKKNKILEELNISLQKEVIQLIKDLKTIPNPTVNPTDTILTSEMPKVGQVINDEVHIGQGIFLKRATYNSCLVSARSGAQFVKNIAVAIYGIDVLRRSSVTGKASNRIKKKDVRPSLDSNKLQAIRDIYRHYLLQKGQDEVSLDFDLSKIGTYISSKISDLNRVTRATKSSSLKSEGKQSEDKQSTSTNLEERNEIEESSHAITDEYDEHHSDSSNSQKD